MGRLEWALDECEDRRQRVRTRPEPELAWWRIKGARQLRGPTRAASRRRSRRGASARPSSSTSRRATCSPSSRWPESCSVHRARARSCRRSAASTAGRRRTAPRTRSLAAVEAGLALEPSRLQLPESDRIDRALAPAVTVIGAWLAQRAIELDLDPAVLATRADLTQMLQGNPSRLANGWRTELVGAPMQRLLSGRGGARARRRRPPDRAPRRHGRVADAERRRHPRHARRGERLTMARFQVGVQLHPQATTVDDAAQPRGEAADALGVDSIWVWDHFYPAVRRSRRRALRGVHAARRDGGRDRARATSARSSRATRTATRTCSPTWRARSTTSATVASCSASARAGSSATTTSTATSSAPRPDGSATSTATCRSSWTASAASNRRPRGRLPILIGGSGEKVTLRLVAEHADAWNTFGPPDELRAQERVLDEWCAKLGPRPAPDRAHGRRSTPAEVDDWQAYLDAGAEHLIVMTGPPFDLDPVRKLLDASRELTRIAPRTQLSSRRVRRRAPCRSAAAAASPSRA